MKNGTKVENWSQGSVCYSMSDYGMAFWMFSSSLIQKFRESPKMKKSIRYSEA